jgi:transposase
VLSLFYLDESGFSNIPNVQRAWAPLGKPHAADASVPRARVNVIGALDYATDQFFYDLHGQSINRDAVTRFIDRLAGRPRSTDFTLVELDNASTHHHFDPVIVHHWLVNHRLLLLHLPAYSPELNLIEMVWKQAKYHWRRFVSWSKERLHDEVNALMANVESKFKIRYV